MKKLFAYITDKPLTEEIVSIFSNAVNRPIPNNIGSIWYKVISMLSENSKMALFVLKCTVGVFKNDNKWISVFGEIPNPMSGSDNNAGIHCIPIVFFV